MNYKKRFFKFILIIGDIILMYSSILLALAVRYNDFSFLPGPQTRLHLSYFSFIFIFWVILLFLLDLYDILPFKNTLKFFTHLIFFLVLAFISGSVYFYIKPIITPKTVLLLNVFILGIFIFLWRFIFYLFLRILHFRERIGIVGSTPELSEITTYNFFKDRYDIAIHIPARLLDISLLKKQAKKEKLDLVVLAMDFYKERDLTRGVFASLSPSLNCISFKNFYENLLSKVPLDSIDEVWFLENFGKTGRAYEISKRFFDITFSIVGLIIVGIFLPLIVLIIQLTSPGPIFYRQKRVGHGEKIFTLYKFRTMKRDAEENGVQWAKEDDPRVTFFGGILRAAHIDELPQFYNILKGDLSFVGPRPERPEFVEELTKKINFYNIRHIIKPGLTGWAQIKYRYGSSVSDAKNKLKYDLYYLKHRSLLFDLDIILRTGVATFKSCSHKFLRHIKKHNFEP